MRDAQGSAGRSLAREDRGRVVRAPDVNETATAPIPLPAAPVHAADAQLADRVAIGSVPEEDRIPRPVLRDQRWIREVEVEQVRVQHRLVAEMLMECVTSDETTAFLLLRGEVQIDSGLGEIELTTILVRLDLPPNGAAGVRVEVHNERVRRDHRFPRYELADLLYPVVRAELVDLIVGGAMPPCGRLDVDPERGEKVRTRNLRRLTCRCLCLVAHVSSPVSPARFSYHHHGDTQAYRSLFLRSFWLQ